MNRLVFLLIAAFWLTMNFLLWRSEFQGSNQIAGTVPPGLVWNKILTAPDDSPLEISWQGRKVGYCRWMANVGEEMATGKAASEDTDPDGMVRRLTGYTIDLEGNLLLQELGGRLRFEFREAFSTNHNWQSFGLKLNLRPMSLELKSKAAERRIDYTFDSGVGRQQKSIAFEELSNPAQLMQGLGYSIPMLPMLGAMEGMPTNAVAGSPLGSLAANLKWSASYDWLTVGHSRVKVYRLEARLLDKHRVVVLVSRVGEILRVELPNDVVLVNDALINL